MVDSIKVAFDLRIQIPDFDSDYSDFQYKWNAKAWFAAGPLVKCEVLHIGFSNFLWHQIWFQKKRWQSGYDLWFNPNNPPLATD